MVPKFRISFEFEFIHRQSRTRTEAHFYALMMCTPQHRQMDARVVRVDKYILSVGMGINHPTYDMQYLYLLPLALLLQLKSFETSGPMCTSPHFRMT